VRARQAAVTAGVSTKALRYYEACGLLEPTRRANGYRDYSEADVRLASEIRALKSLGLTTEETRPFLECLRAGHFVGDDCPESLAAYQSKIDDLDDLISRMTDTRAAVMDQLQTAARRGFRHHRGQDPPRVLPAADPLPAGLPTPQDDGAARHLVGCTLPPLTFETTSADSVRLDQVSVGRWVLFLYPLTGEPGVDMPQGWDQIPGARGCSQEACSFRDNLADMQAAGAEQVVALSSDAAEYQQDLVRRLHIPYRMLSDPDLSLAADLDLPRFEADGWELYKRLTLVVDGATIRHAFYPVFPPDRHAVEVLDWLRANPVVPG
jgi:peroxiredoxin/DNA-binding transcriptional MerR regulator